LVLSGRVLKPAILLLSKPAGFKTRPLESEKLFFNHYLHQKVTSTFSCLGTAKE